MDERERNHVVDVVVTVREIVQLALFVDDAASISDSCNLKVK